MRLMFREAVFPIEQFATSEPAEEEEEITDADLVFAEDCRPVVTLAEYSVPSALPSSQSCDEVRIQMSAVSGPEELFAFGAPLTAEIGYDFTERMPRPKQFVIAYGARRV